jgi:tetratricopeptide (TPR) repeat protein
VFEVHDRIASGPNSFSDEDVNEGLQLANKLDHRGLYSYFLLLKAQRTYEAGDISLARELNLDVVQILRELCSKDPVYNEQLQKAQVNGAISAALDGDFTTARALAAEVQGGESEKSLGPLREVLLEQPTFGDDLEKVSEQAGDYLESGDLDLVRALEWYGEAERIAIARNDEAALCGLLGDKAVAFRHLGNTQRAIETYRQVIELSRARDDWLNLSRWSQNLGGIWLERDDLSAAEACFKEGMQAALKSGSAEQISFATTNNSMLQRARAR